MAQSGTETARFSLSFLLDRLQRSRAGVILNIAFFLEILREMPEGA
jgi:hypothetical protein